MKKEWYINFYRQMVSKCSGFITDEFLGRAVYSNGCEILNEKDITFNYGSDSVTLRAIAFQPLQVHNKALG
jgi:hypothetical protein